MSAIEKSEKPARNLLIRKFSELIVMKSLEEALSHLSEKELNDALFSLHKNNPDDAILARKAKTLEMTKVIDEIKCLLTQSEKSNLLSALRFESQELESQIIVTKKAIDKRAQSSKLMNDTLEKLQLESHFDKALLLATPEFFEAIDHLNQAEPVLFEEKYQFLSLLRETAGLKEKIVDKDKAHLLDAIKSNAPETLKHSLNQARESIRYHNILATFIEKYAEEKFFSNLFTKEQTQGIAAAKGFFKPRAKNPARLAHITVLELLARELASDESLSLIQKGDCVYSLCFILMEESEEYPFLKTTLEKTMRELESSTFINNASDEIVKSEALDILSKRLNIYLDGKKLKARDRRMLEVIKQYNQASVTYS